MKKLTFNQVYLKGSAHTIGQIPPKSLPEVAVVGRSNVGKSSLINHLFKRKSLARSSASPGKTRAVHFFCADDLVLFADLPGYGYASASKSEQEKWRRLTDHYLESREELDLILFLLDARRTLNRDDLMFLEWCAARGLPFLIVLTKVDKLKKSELQKKRKELKEQYGEPVLTSTTKNLGRRELIAAIEGSLWGD